jgi:hypothetical protein
LPTGRDQVNHPAHGNIGDDACNAASIALVLAASKRKPFVISEEVIARFSRPALPAFQSPGRSPRCYFN